ncbi:MAG: exodeoxyribonuclease VII large subunit [Alistipes sp.]|nr:exodeoxyribonuclease VII large subunit [Alistipes sp.]
MYESPNIETSQNESLTLLDLQRMVRATLESRFEEPMWLRAEISELKVNRSGHCYLNLVEKGVGSGAPCAEARAVIWRSAYAAISSKFESATGAPLTSGIAVLVRVLVTYHEVYGFSLQIVDLDAGYTLGEVERRRRETIELLKSDGVWDMNRELDKARPTLRIAIISSATAAGFQDFREEIARSYYRFNLTLFESLMQGDAAEQSIVDALTAIAEREDEFDAVAIIRGGGSTSDLALFDSYIIATYVAQFPLPIFTGIGHDKDVSVVDMVAHTSCKTPTAVATTLVEMADQEMATLEDYALRLRDNVVARINQERLRLERQGNDLIRSSILLVSGLQHRLDTTEESIANNTRRIIERERQRLDTTSEIIDSHNPESILRRGFAIVRDGEGRAIKIGNIAIGESVNIELIDGGITAEVRDKKTKRKRCQQRE